MLKIESNFLHRIMVTFYKDADDKKTEADAKVKHKKIYIHTFLLRIKEEERLKIVSRRQKRSKNCTNIHVFNTTELKHVTESRI